MRISVFYGESLVGRLNDDTGPMLFQYDNDFLDRNIELSPFYLPLQRGVIEESTGNLPGPQVLQEAAGSPGGRFPKLLIGWNEEREKFLIGSRDYPDDYLPCILKLDMGKLEASHNQGLCRKEYQLLTAARAAGIETSDHWLIEGEDPEQGPFAHLLVQRFDRAGPIKIHTHSFGGVTHQLPVRYGSSYEDLFRTTLALCKDQRQIVQQFRRMVFNVLSGNRDDHVRNHSFLFNESTGWKLSPAYDLTPTPAKPEHALSINSKWNSIEDTDLLAVADLFSINKASEIVGQCRDTLNDHGLLQS